MATLLIVGGVLALVIASGFLGPYLLKLHTKITRKKPCRSGCGSKGWDVLRTDYERKHCRCRECGWVHEKPRSHMV